MATNTSPMGPRTAIEIQALGGLIPALERRGYRVIGPTVRDGAIVYEEIGKLEDLPAGWGDKQECGQYRLRKRGDEALFGYTAGAQSWKRYLHPPELQMVEFAVEGGGFRPVKKAAEAVKYAFVGVRACELAAIRVHDRIFLGDRYVEPGYEGRRKNVLMVAVNCTEPGGTCFCASMGTGPRVEAGFDILLTELTGSGRHVLVAEAGSETGAQVLAELERREAAPEELEAADRAVAEAAGRMGRTLERDGVRELLYESFEHPRWERTAARCLACGNCTMSCPTCFCTTVEDTSDVAGARAERRRKWDSCFTESFSYIHGGSVRSSVKSRYRQWLTHKLAAWVDQFGTSGCVGCGRCITWCPGRIDITEEVKAMRGAEVAG
jgi:sulfhydrogenase subunit beta (sulfur reductase)